MELQKKKAVGFLLKVPLANLTKSGKVGDVTRQAYFTVDESTANVQSLEALCRQEFDDATIRLVSGNGLLIEDNEVTRSEY